MPSWKEDVYNFFFSLSYSWVCKMENEKKNLTSYNDILRYKPSSTCNSPAGLGIWHPTVLYQLDMHMELYVTRKRNILVCFDSPKYRKKNVDSPQWVPLRFPHRVSFWLAWPIKSSPIGCIHTELFYFFYLLMKVVLIFW